MNVLFWVDKFPAFSETFIRDQIVCLLQENINVKIYSENRINSNDQIALIGHESYKLTDRLVFKSDFIVRKKHIRVFKALCILISSLYKGTFMYYVKSLNYKQYGREALSFRHFFQVDYLLRNKIDVIHAHFGPNGKRASSLIEMGLPIKLFVTFHGYDVRLGEKKGVNFYKSLFKLATGIISISNYNKDRLLFFGADRDKIINLSNGINTNFFKRLEPNLILGTIEILTVARLVDEKALHIAIEAMSIVIKNNPNLRFNYKIIGGGTLLDNLNSLVFELGIEKFVNFLGVKSTVEVRNQMIKSNIFLLSSIAEALPTVLLEAQSCELMIVATEVGSVKDIVKNGEIVKPNSVKALVKGLQAIISKKSFWKENGKRGRDFIIENYSIHEKTKILMDYYESF